MIQGRHADTCRFRRNDNAAFFRPRKGRIPADALQPAYGSGNRIDQKFAAKKARDMITAYYEEAKAWYEETEVNLADYRNSDGGFGILPYAESDLRTTALVTPLVAEEIGSGELRKYYYGILFNGKENVKPAALYGMAAF